MFQRWRPDVKMTVQPWQIIGGLYIGFMILRLKPPSAQCIRICKYLRWQLPSPPETLQQSRQLHAIVPEPKGGLSRIHTSDETTHCNNSMSERFCTWCFTVVVKWLQTQLQDFFCTVAKGGLDGYKKVLRKMLEGLNWASYTDFWWCGVAGKWRGGVGALNDD